MNILYYFECECDLYFRKLSKGKTLNNIANEELENYYDNIINNLSIKYFRKAMEYILDERQINNNFDLAINKIAKLYCLAYIKIYLKKLSEFLVYNMNKNILNFNDAYNILLCKNNNNNIYALKIYLFKCIFKNINTNYLQFLEFIRYDQNLHPLINHDQFGNVFNARENSHCYNFSFINIHNYEIYNKLSNIIEISLQNIEKQQDYNNIAKYINDNKNNYKGFELMYNILINKFVFDFLGNQRANNNMGEKANSYVKWFDKKINIHNNSKILIYYLINRNQFQTRILPKLKLPRNQTLNEDLFFILFYSIKLVISIQQTQNNIYSYFYQNKNNLIRFINNNFIPGAFPQTNEQIEAYYEIEEHLRTQPSNYGLYMCSCGQYYTVAPCGYPMQISNCTKCGSQIGGTNHILLKRPGHFRIILDEQAKIRIIDRGYKDMSYMLLRDFKRERIDPLLNRPSQGIGKIGKEKINKTGFNIRNNNELSFRIMNFVIYCHLLMSNILDILNDYDIAYYISEETSCFDIMISNWNKMQELLNQIGINNIKIFMNIIFERIVQIISKYNINASNTEEGRNTIEYEFNRLINLNELQREIKAYEQQNQHIINSSPTNISSLIQQLYPITFYQNREPYHYFKYLYIYSLPKISEVINIIDSNNNFKNKYPLTLKMLKFPEKDNKNISLLKYIPTINKKVNHLINNYSYKISRDEASKKTIKEEYNKKENNIFKINNINPDEDINTYMRDLFNLFKKFKNIPLQWGCHPLAQMTINSDSVLCSILLDDNEPGYYLASIYKKLIEYQNLFLDGIINYNSQNGLLHCFTKQLKSEIMIQDANINEIVKLNINENEKNNLKLYSDIDEIIIVNTSNDPFTNKFNYELDQIEIELGNIILPGIRKFKCTDDELRYVTYMFEGYRGKNSNILTNFNEKYPPKELTQNEKNILHYFIRNFAQDDYKNFLFCIQILINYIQNSGKAEDISIYIIIENIPDHITIDHNIKSFFNSNREIPINKLVRIFEFFEHLCWNQIKDNLLDEYKKPLEEGKIKLIENYYNKNNDINNNIKKIDLASAVRKFISRYLAGKRSQSEIGEDKMLFDYLIRVDLWEINIDVPEFENEFFELSKFKITVGEGKDFYDKLGGDNKKLEMFLKDEEDIEHDINKDEKNNENDEDGNRNDIIMDKRNKNKEESDEEEDIIDRKSIKENKEVNNKNNAKRRKLF